MMYVGILFWVLVAGAVLFYLLWGLDRAASQRKGWRAFAAKYKLVAAQEGKGAFATFSLTGNINGRRVFIYSTSERAPGGVLIHPYTHIEVFLKKPPEAMFILSRKLLPAIYSNLSLPNLFSPELKGWPSLSVSLCDAPFALGNWFNHGRVAAMSQFMDMAQAPDVETMAFSDGGTAFLLWRGEAPLSNPRDLNAIVQKMFAYARALDGADEPPVQV